MKKYRALFEQIESYEVVKETPKQIIYINNSGREIREQKMTGYYSWHDSYDDAKQALIEKHSDDVEKKERQLEYAKEKLRKVGGLLDV